MNEKEEFSYLARGMSFPISCHSKVEKVTMERNQLWSLKVFIKNTISTPLKPALDHKPLSIINRVFTGTYQILST